jgi:hypothetical protein
MRTLVAQSYRTENVPAAIDRCMASVRSWAAAQGYDYEFRGDDLFALCGADYLARAGDNKRTITNLARLEWIRSSFDQGYERAIWLDADIFIFDPARFSLDLREGYAFSKDTFVWWGGGPMVAHATHNAALVFAGLHPDLDWMINLVRYIAASRPLHDNFQVGVKLLTGLHAGLRFPLLTTIGTLGPDVLRSVAARRATLPRILAEEHGFPIYAANMALSLHDQIDPIALGRAMDLLEDSCGRIINDHLGPNPAAPLLVSDYGPVYWRRVQPSLARRIAGSLLKEGVKERLRPLFRRFH